MLLHKLVQHRRFKLIIVKDIRVERDLEFINLINAPFITARDTLVVMTRTERKHKVDLKQYSEGRISKAISVQLMPVAEKSVKYRSFVRSLEKAIAEDLTFSNAEIKMKISSQVYQFQGQALDVLCSAIDGIFKSILEQGFSSIMIQPYDVTYLRESLNGQVRKKIQLTCSTH